MVMQFGFRFHPCTEGKVLRWVHVAFYAVHRRCTGKLRDALCFRGPLSSLDLLI